MEAKLQSEIIKWLKGQGCYVIKTRPGPGVPVGCPDVIALLGTRWIAIEVKASAKSPFRAGQNATLSHLKYFYNAAGNFVYVAHPENWSAIKHDLIARFF